MLFYGWLAVPDTNLGKSMIETVYVHILNTSSLLSMNNSPLLEPPLHSELSTWHENNTQEMSILRLNIQRIYAIYASNES